ncbi:FeoA family protein [Pseudooceanicola nanhaiensis]|uniref:FeoA family protein n=1 Tax=Pseudooceanicola nanhaiensis TaxID=375761 RepID=UPI001CD1E335|nr:FeoA domain-containing protein [Pseudooceanicola nanhaiensis]MCA0918800.1 FeoA domain-containing protein [Pseudooceanicola nanhaiensis]
MELRQIDATDRSLSLGEARRGYRGRVVCILPIAGNGRLAPSEMERRLIEMGFIEGVEVSVIHEGPFGRDPIAVRVGEATVAMRRRDAMAILTE